MIYDIRDATKIIQKIVGCKNHRIQPKIFVVYFPALCSPACTLTTDTCVGLNSCKCGTSDPCGGDVLSNRCLNSACVCGVSSTCTTGTTTAVCLDNLRQTPGSSNTIATCKVRYNISCESKHVEKRNYY